MFTDLRWDEWICMWRWVECVALYRVRFILAFWIKKKKKKKSFVCLCCATVNTIPFLKIILRISILFITCWILVHRRHSHFLFKKKKNCKHCLLFNINENTRNSNKWPIFILWFRGKSELTSPGTIGVK